MSRGRKRVGLFVGATFVAAMLVGPANAFAAQAGSPSDSNLTADLDGKPIELSKVGSYYCHDFAYPKIHCFSRAAALEASVQPVTAASSITYVIIYDYAAYAGPYMYVSQNYTVLATIGWNDRISSFIGLNNQNGRFWTDWFYSGSYYNFCCNIGVASLGNYDNQISSMYTY